MIWSTTHTVGVLLFDVLVHVVLTCCARGSLVLFGAGAGEAATVGVLTGAAVLTREAGAR